MKALLDLQRYPLHRPLDEDALAVAASAHQQLASTGICALPGFVHPEAAARMAAQALAREGAMFSGAVSHNIYQEDEPDPAFDAAHPRNRALVTHCLRLPDDEIPEDAPLRRIYIWDPLTRFISAIVHGPPAAPPPLYRFADPLGSLTVNVVREGQEIAWHFDQAPFVVILLLQAAESGGAYEVAPESRWRADGLPDYELHARVLDGREPGVVSRRFTPGSLVIHRGTRSLHRVAPVHGVTPRVSALLSYADRPGRTLSPSVRLSYYGRTEPRRATG